MLRKGFAELSIGSILCKSCKSCMYFRIKCTAIMQDFATWTVPAHATHCFNIFNRGRVIIPIQHLPNCIFQCNVKPPNNSFKAYTSTSPTTLPTIENKFDKMLKLQELNCIISIQDIQYSSLFSCPSFLHWHGIVHLNLCWTELLWNQLVRHPSLSS